MSAAHKNNEKDIENASILYGCLKSCLLFSRLSEKDISIFHNVVQARTYKKGKVLYLQDEPADYFYVICRGWIKLFHSMPDGEDVVIDMLSAGDVVGESAVFEQGLHTSSSEIVEDVFLLSIPSKSLKEQVILNPQFALAMLSSMFQHHRRHYDAIALNAMQSAPQRIGCFLLRLCPLNKSTNIAFDLPYDKTLIAYILGMKSATFSRALEILRKKTGLRIKGVHIEIDSIAPLMKFVYGALTPQYMPKDM